MQDIIKCRERRRAIEGWHKPADEAPCFWAPVNWDLYELRESLREIRRRGVNLGETAETPGDVGSDSLEGEREYVQRNFGRLLTEYEDQFIAVVGQSVVDHDPDFSRLAERVFSKFGYKSIFMPLITRSRSVYRIHGPRKVR